MEMVSDAAGFQMGSSEKMGVGNIGMDEDGCVVFVSQIFWPNDFKKATDSSGKSLGCKTTTLELLGLVIPFLVCPEILAGKHVVLKVDNIGCYYGWKNRSVAGDKMASILVRALVFLSSYICSYVHVVYLPRMSSWEARICDRMSRECTTTSNDKKLLKEFGHVCPEVLENWMKNPSEDWTLPIKLLNYLEQKI
jgi:hypothetical protein